MNNKTTTVYFIRHAQSDRTYTEDRTRPLTAEGKKDGEKIAEVLKDKGITRIISSPYTRTLQTVEKLAEALKLEAETHEDLRERNAGKWHGDRFFDFIKMQWEDFDCHIEDGECLRQVQERNVRALKEVLEKYKGETIAVATHGTALSTIINYYYPKYGFEDFLKIVDLMPLVVKMDFEAAHKCNGIEEIFSVHRPYK